MKITNILWIPVACLLLACEHDVATQTIVHEDGSLDRAVALEKDSKTKAVARSDMFAPDLQASWKSEKLSVPAPEDSVDTHYIERFTRHFASAEEANRVMNTNDEFFHIESRYEKKFRWFYTYMVYSDTYKALWRPKRVPLSDYFTSEDYAFIKRLPAESSKISKSDSLYLDQLNTKFSEQYATHSFFEEYYAKLQDIVQHHVQDNDALDSLKHNKEKLFRIAVEKDISDTVMLAALDSIGIRLTGPAYVEYKRRGKDLEHQMNVFVEGYTGKYVHHIQMPWPIVASNADSVVGNSLFWKPPVIKFLVTDYTMQAESRRLNYWAVIVSGVFIVAAGVLTFRRRRLS